jgi:hypothetical protein
MEAFNNKLLCERVKELEKNKEFWKEELKKCKADPEYYYTTYVRINGMPIVMTDAIRYFIKKYLKHEKV